MVTKDIISKKTRKEFREYLVGYTLREIEMEFAAADIDCDSTYTPINISGQRRTLVEQYYHTVDWTNWRDVSKIIRVFESILNQAEENATPDPLQGGTSYTENAKNVLSSLSKCIKKDGFEYSEGKLLKKGIGVDTSDLHIATAIFDIPELHRQIDRIKLSIDSDPALAIGTAKELLETTCKTILADHGIEYGKSEEVLDLVKKVRKILGLVPENVSDSAKGENTIRRLLSSLATVAQLRNLYGTGHRRHGKAKGLTSRHARLAVSSVSTLVVLALLASW